MTVCTTRTAGVGYRKTRTYGRDEINQTQRRRSSRRFVRALVIIIISSIIILRNNWNEMKTFAVFFPPPISSGVPSPRAAYTELRGTRFTVAHVTIHWMIMYKLIFHQNAHRRVMHATTRAYHLLGIWRSRKPYRSKDELIDVVQTTVLLNSNSTINNIVYNFVRKIQSEHYTWRYGKKKN